MTRRPAAVFLALLVAACGTQDAAAPPGPPDQSYTVRGVVVALPTEGARVAYLSLRHEAIPEFVGREGDVVGMDSMTMPFALADPALAAGLAPGDEVEATLEIRWEADEPATLTRVEPLPAGAELDFE